MAIEPLATKIRENDYITGMTINNKQHKINLYADDMLLFLENPLKSIEILKQTLLEFDQYTELRINYEKSKVSSLDFS